MKTLFDILAEAQNGEALGAIQRQFQLNQDQTMKAVEALLPAFSEGMRRNASDPMGAGRFMEAIASGAYGKYYENMAAAMQPGGINPGNEVLGQLFGSKDLSRAVARQAEATTGLGQEILKQLLPVLASALMGGFFKQASGQASRASSATTGNVFIDMMAEMMKGGMGRPQERAPSANPFEEMLKQMTGSGASGGASNPFGDMLEQIMGGQTGAPSARRQKPASGNPYQDMLGQMFETGREVQDDYRRNVESIFDQYLENMKRHQ